MEIRNSFAVSLPIEQTWRVLLDIERIAPCMPGAELTESLGSNAYKGKVSVRLGPVALAFSGTAKFEEVNHEEYRALVKAQGTDSKGRGGANAVVSFQLEPAGSETRVLVRTDLNLSGAVAQYGRGVGMIQSVANQLIGQFAANLEGVLSQSPDLQAEPAAGEPPATPTAPQPPRAAKPISGFSLLLSALWESIRRLFSGKAHETSPKQGGS